MGGAFVQTRWQGVRWGDSAEILHPRATAPGPSPDLVSVPSLGGAGRARAWVLSWSVDVLQEPLPLYPLDRGAIELITGIGSAAMVTYIPLAPSIVGRPSLQSIQLAAEHVRARVILATSLPLPLLGDVRWRVTVGVAPYAQPTDTEV